MSQMVHGWRFPGGVDVPTCEEQPGFWSVFEDNSGERVYIASAKLIIDVGRQLGAVWSDPEVVIYDKKIIERSSMSDGSSSDKHDELPHVTVRHTVMYDGEEYSRYGSADANTNGLEDMVATAETKALKRTIQSAVGIWDTGSTPDTNPEPSEPPDEPNFGGFG